MSNRGSAYDRSAAAFTGLAAAVLIWLLSAATPASAAWRTFTEIDGLASPWVYAICEDHSGNLWFGTFEGVTRCDGTTWRTFTTADSLGANKVMSILEDHSGNMWFAVWWDDGTREPEGRGVTRYDGVSWKTFTTADGLSGNRVQDLFEDRDGILWAATLYGVSRYDPRQDRWQAFPVGTGLINRYVYCIAQDHDGNMWFGTREGVSCYNGSTWQPYLAGTMVTAILEDRAGNLWFGTGGKFGTPGKGVIRLYRDGTLDTLTTADGLASNNVRCILEDTSGNFWFGTLDPDNYFPVPGDGVSRYDGFEWRSYRFGDGLGQDAVGSMIQDRFGNIWFATMGGGVSRFDDSSWDRFTTSNGLGNNYIMSVTQDRRKNLWVATDRGGVDRFNGSTWRKFDTSDGLADSSVFFILEDHGDNLWFATKNGVSRFDGVDSTWKTFRAPDGLAYPLVWSIEEDRSGKMWFATGHGVSVYDGTLPMTIPPELAGRDVRWVTEDRDGTLWFATFPVIVDSVKILDGGVIWFDGSNWYSFTTENSGLAHDAVWSVMQDSAGNMWFGTDTGGVSRLNPAAAPLPDKWLDGSWSTLTTTDGLAGPEARGIVEDREGRMWFGTRHGLSLYDGSTWRTYARFASNEISCLLEDATGNLWIGSTFMGGLNRYTPDRVSPWTLFRVAPPPVTAARSQTALFEAFAETEGIDFSYRLDGGPWSLWSLINSWSGVDLADGVHRLEVRSRDFALNIDPGMASTTFEIDATPPVPVITSPPFGQPVRGAVDIMGTVADARFMDYRLLVRPAGAASWDPPQATLLAQSTTPINEGILATWNTSSLPDGLYEIHLTVSDTLGLTGTGLVTVVVDNQAPYADETTPARVTAAEGGDVFTTNADVHLYFPPHGFARDAVVMVTPIDPTSLGAAPAGGTAVADRAFDISWSGGALVKTARLELSYDAALPSSGMPAVYYGSEGTVWERLGGTLDPDARRVSLPITKSGRYALFVDSTAPTGRRSLSTVSFTPRVFSPTGTFGDRKVGISFTLGSPGAVTVKVYDSAGRLVRDVVSSASLGAGANLIYWNGRDREEAVVPDGIYLVTVEAFGNVEKKVLAVVK